MAREGSIQINNKREKLILRYKEKRNKLKKLIKDKNISIKERYELVQKLSRLPRNSTPARHRRRCAINGRPRGVSRRYGICRNEFRRLASLGCLPGVEKSSR